MVPVFFSKQSDLRKWFEKHHLSETEFIIGFYKIRSGKPSITWSQAVDEALCFGWIDSKGMSIDDERYQIRFTKRKPDSIWSAVNIKKIAALKRKSLMFPAGLESYQKRKAGKSKIYTHENEKMDFDLSLEKIFKKNKAAWKYFAALAPSYIKLSTNWVMSAKQETTKLRRMNKLIADSESGINMWKDNKYKKKPV